VRLNFVKQRLSKTVFLLGFELINTVIRIIHVIINKKLNKSSTTGFPFGNALPKRKAFVK